MNTDAANNKQPLVSVLCRSMNRPELTDALASVNRQSYSNIEIILVDASGNGISVHNNMALRFPVLAVTGAGKLNRPAAANAALQSAAGDYLLFLDEDDWIADDHIQQLVYVLEADSGIGVAYSGTRITTAGGALTNNTLNIDFDPARLRRDNFIPIHSALFRKTLLSDGARFDDSLEIFEDWDFWLQLAARTRFVHIDALTAFYRQGGESNTASDDPMTRYQTGHAIATGRERVFDKWLPTWKGGELNQTLGSLDQNALIQTLHKDIHRLNNDITGLNNDVALLQNETRTLNHSISKLNQTINRKNAELEESRGQVEHLSNYITMLQHSLSWRVTRPLRWLRRKVESLRPAKPVADEFMSAGELKANLDSPNGKQNEFGKHLVVSGWCCSPNGIAQIEALVDGNSLASFCNGISRPDVAELFPAYKDSSSAGFHCDIPLQDINAGEHALELRFTDNSNLNHTITATFFVFKDNDLYNMWYWRNLPDDEELAQIKISSDQSTQPQTFHLLVCDVSQESLLLATLSSLAEQAASNFVLHIQHSRLQNMEDFFRSTSGRMQEIHWHTSTGSALELISASNDWVGILKAGESLAPHALAEFALPTASSDTRLIYSDHDMVSPSGIHLEPTFTPQWSPEHLLSSNYIGGFFICRTDMLAARDGIDYGNPAWRYGLLLRVSEQIDAPGHAVHRIPKVLWSAHDSASAPELLQHEKQVLSDWLARRHPGADVLERHHGLRSVLWPLTGTPKVSIIIPTMGKLELIKPCIDSLIEKTVYPDFEVIMLDNSRGKFPQGIQYLKDRQLKVIECNEAFNWARLNNIGTQHASGDLYLFLNDDIEITTSDWLAQLVRQALRPDVGTVGALLYYPNGALQHTGVLLVNYGGGGIHLLHKRMPDSGIYRNMHQTVREVSANTGACLMVSREKFQKIGGFDEELAVVGNDVDLCLRMLEQGYRNVWTPLCHLIHHESISRKTSVPKEDEKAMWQRWSSRFVAGDNYYNPNLSTDSCDFTLQVNNLRSRATASTHAAGRKKSRQLLPGVNLIGYTRAEMGIGEGARSDARALDAADEPFGIICVTSGNPSRMKDLGWQYKEIDHTPYDVTLLHVNPDHALQVINELPSDYFDDHYRIGYWAWELPEIPQDWEKAFLHFDEIWVPSGFVQDAVAMKSPIPVVRIPHSIEINHDTSITRDKLGLPQDPFLFLMMFDTHSRQERKNPYGAIAAFRKAFADNDLSVRLVVKVNNSSPEALAALREKAGTNQNILFLDKVYNREEVNAIIANCDCFVSLHRSEGFGFGPAEAMALGKVIIATNWSGNIDYMRPDNSLGINYQLVTLEDNFGPYNKGQVWAEPDIEQAAQAMANIAHNTELARSLGKNAMKTIMDEFSPKAVGTMMRKRLAAIRQTRT